MEVTGLFPGLPEEQQQPLQPKVAAGGRPSRDANRHRGANRRMDMVATLPNGCMRLVDNTLWDGAAPTWVRKADALRFPLRALVEAEKKKAKKYDADKPPNSTFSTFAMGTQCELGKQAQAWLQKWAREVVEAEEGDYAPGKAKVRRVVWQALQELGVAVIKAQAKQIFDHATSATRRRLNLPRASPAAALLGASRRRRNARGRR